MKRRIITFGRYFGEFMDGLTIKEEYYEYKRNNDSGL